MILRKYNNLNMRSFLKSIEIMWSNKKIQQQTLVYISIDYGCHLSPLKIINGFVFKMAFITIESWIDDILITL